MKRLFLLATAAVLALLAGCAQLGLQKPASTEDQLRYGQSGVSAAYKTIGDLKASNSITVDEGVSMFKKVESVEKELAAAEKLLGGPQASTAAGKIALALQALTMIQTELKARQGKSAAVDMPAEFGALYATGA